MPLQNMSQLCVVVVMELVEGSQIPTMKVV